MKATFSWSNVRPPPCELRCLQSILHQALWRRRLTVERIRLVDINIDGSPMSPVHISKARLLPATRRRNATSPEGEKRPEMHTLLSGISVTFIWCTRWAFLYSSIMLRDTQTNQRFRPASSLLASSHRRLTCSHEMPWNAMKCHEMPWNAMKCHEMPWNAMSKTWAWLTYLTNFQHLAPSCYQVAWLCAIFGFPQPLQLNFNEIKINDPSLKICKWSHFRWIHKSQTTSLSLSLTQSWKYSDHWPLAIFDIICGPAAMQLLHPRTCDTKARGIFLWEQRPCTATASASKSPSNQASLRSFNTSHLHCQLVSQLALIRLTWPDLTVGSFFETEWTFWCFNFKDVYTYTRIY